MTIGLAASVGAVLVSWSSLELGRPAWHPHDIDSIHVQIGEVRDLTESNTTLIRQSEWWRINEKILTLEGRLQQYGYDDSPILSQSIREQIIELKRERHALDVLLRQEPLTNR